MSLILDVLSLRVKETFAMEPFLRLAVVCIELPQNSGATYRLNSPTQAKGTLV